MDNSVMWMADHAEWLLNLPRKSPFTLQECKQVLKYVGHALLINGSLMQWGFLRRRFRHRNGKRLGIAHVAHFACTVFTAVSHEIHEMWEETIW